MQISRNKPKPQRIDFRFETRVETGLAVRLAKVNSPGFQNIDRIIELFFIIHCFKLGPFWQNDVYRIRRFLDFLVSKFAGAKIYGCEKSLMPLMLLRATGRYISRLRYPGLYRINCEPQRLSTFRR